MASSASRERLWIRAREALDGPLRHLLGEHEAPLLAPVLLT